jgi:hypothetical protein
MTLYSRRKRTVNKGKKNKTVNRRRGKGMRGGGDTKVEIEDFLQKYHNSQYTLAPNPEVGKEYVYQHNINNKYYKNTLKEIKKTKERYNLPMTQGVKLPESREIITYKFDNGDTCSSFLYEEKSEDETNKVVGGNQLIEAATERAQQEHWKEQREIEAREEREERERQAREKREEIRKKNEETKRIKQEEEEREKRNRPPSVLKNTPMHGSLLDNGLTSVGKKIDDTRNKWYDFFRSSSNVDANEAEINKCKQMLGINGGSKKWGGKAKKKQKQKQNQKESSKLNFNIIYFIIILKFLFTIFLISVYLV